MLALLAVVVLMASSGVQADTSQRALQAPLTTVQTKVVTPAAQQAALGFWTHDRIAAADPLPMPVDRGSAAPVFASDQSGPSGLTSAGAPAPGADAVAQRAYPQDWAKQGGSGAIAGAQASEPTGTSQVYTSYIANASGLQKLYPHKWIGRLSFSTASGTSYCSATSISNNIMLTAAHCLYDSTNNVWYSNWVFTPAYRNGNAPYGTFAATTCRVLTAWVNLTGSFAINSWTRHDVGVCNMGNNTAGQTLNNAVGWMGRQWNFPYVRHFHDLGYPFRDYNDALLTDAGKWLRICAAESFQQTTETRGMGCNWSRGISGGPWMVGYAPNYVSGNADGVNSGFFAGTQNLYSARFNSNNIVPLCTAAGC
jgi:hypothetical protein